MSNQFIIDSPLQVASVVRSGRTLTQYQQTVTVESALYYRPDTVHSHTPYIYSRLVGQP
jgi:hypothetical protein